MTWFAYVFSCAWEDHCKIGFSRDPLARIGQLHPRWFEFFDLASGFLVEAETERDARDLELELRRPLGDHRAPQPIMVRDAAGGRTEWVRGALGMLACAGDALALRGHVVHVPVYAWLREAMGARRPLLYEWTIAQLGTHPACGPPPVSACRSVRDMLDACAALDVPLEGALSPEIARWYAARRAH